VRNNLYHLSSKRLFWNKYRKKNEGGGGTGRKRALNKSVGVGIVLLLALG